MFDAPLPVEESNCIGKLDVRAGSEDGPLLLQPAANSINNHTVLKKPLVGIGIFIISHTNYRTQYARMAKYQEYIVLIGFRRKVVQHVLETWSFWHGPRFNMRKAERSSQHQGLAHCIEVLVLERYQVSPTGRGFRSIRPARP